MLFTNHGHSDALLTAARGWSSWLTLSPNMGDRHTSLPPIALQAILACLEIARSSLRPVGEPVEPHRAIEGAIGWTLRQALRPICKHPAKRLSTTSLFYKANATGTELMPVAL